MSLTASDLERIRSEITADRDNAWAAAANYQPIYVADAAARIAIVGQAPGRKAQESGIPWNDASGARLIDWLGVDETTFRASSRFALLPMDFYYPGKGPHGDLPSCQDFAARWQPADPPGDAPHSAGASGPGVTGEGIIEAD
ncbi:uracil-DNA glycosylase family protein [Nonomuraea cypriaca]|uniref:uracil-DNA glycosylase family protein n=1 Tax=Nonomuraea cypriaca TaxID=1187855 RepID=UPI0038B2A5A1